MCLIETFEVMEEKKGYIKLEDLEVYKLARGLSRLGWVIYSKMTWQNRKIIGDQFHPFNYQMGQRSQDLEPLYFENGLLYIAKASLIQERILMNENSFPMLVNHQFAKVDIDTQEDFDYAEYLINKFKNHNS